MAPPRTSIPETPWIWHEEVVLISGGSRGIGAHVAQHLAVKGIKVIILDLHDPKEDLGKIAFLFLPALPHFSFPCIPPKLTNKLTGSNIYFYQCDVTSSAQVSAVGKAIHDEHGHPTVLINNAGVGFSGTILAEPIENIQTTLSVNMLSHFIMVKQFLPAMIERNHGHVVTVASMASFVTIAQNVDYSCTKAGLVAFHEGLGQELKWRYGGITGVRTR
jgi:all-trans-retinol dehydrogenase (NAD+)